METIKLTTKLSVEEKETVLVYDNITKTWTMDTTIPRHMNKAKRQGWKQTVSMVYEDGTECGGVFEAPARAITIRSTEKKQLSDKQLKNLHSGDEDDED